MADLKTLEEDNPELVATIKELRTTIDAVRALRAAGVGGPALHPIRPFDRFEGIEIAKKNILRNPIKRKRLTVDL